MSRRSFVAATTATLAAPAVLTAARTGYSWAELEKIIARGDVKGKLTKADLPTPALTLDLDAFEFNVNKMVTFVKGKGRAIRPHGKTHKCPEIAKRLIQAGAVGACAAKLSEAEVFAQHGIRGLLVTTAVVGPYKIERAVRLAKLAPDTIFVTDNVQNVQDLDAAAGEAKVKLNLAVDLWMGRTGIKPLDPAVSLVEAMQPLKNVKFTTVQAYSGSSSHVIGFEERRKFSREAMAAAVETRRMIEKKGIACSHLTGGSTGTYNIDSDIDGITELQPGSFMFMDVDYNRIGGSDGNALYSDFKNSLIVYTTVVSKPADDTAIVDGGLKAFSTDKPFPPEFRDRRSGVKFNFAGDEHGKLSFGETAKALQVGDKAEFIIPHCDPSVNLYDKMFCLRGDNVEAIWKIAARGMSQ